MWKVLEFIKNNKWLLDIDFDNRNQLRSFFKKHYSDKKGSKIAFAKLCRDSKIWFDRDLDFPSDEKIKNIIYLLNNYIKLGEKYIPNADFNIYKREINEKLNKQGWLVSNHIKLSTINLDNLYFFKSQHIIKYLLETGENINMIKISDDIILTLNETFNAKIKGTRAFSATLERQKWLRKVESFTFTIRKENELEIATEAISIIEKEDFNFMGKERIFELCEEIIEKYSLFGDELYYILKELFPKKFYYSTGNSMFIAKDETFAKLTIIKRLQYFSPKNPIIMTLKESEEKFGVNKFSKINFDAIIIQAPTFLYFDHKNTDHIKFMKNIFDQFIDINKNGIFTIFMLRKYLKTREDLFSKQFWNLNAILPILKKIYVDKIIQLKNNNHLMYKTKNKTYLDVDDWSDF